MPEKNPEKFKMSPHEIPLSIELVPTTCWWSNVRSNISRKDWKKLRDEQLSASGYRCQVCLHKPSSSSRWLELHELWDYQLSDYKLSGVQKLIGLQILCKRCHEVKHAGLSFSRGKYPEVIQRLQNVNKWDLETAQDYIRFMFEQWDARSEIEWELDISLLDRYGIKYKKERKEKRV